MSRDWQSSHRKVTEAMADEAIRSTVRRDEADDISAFRQGDAVVYAAHGVGSIDKVGLQEVGGHLLQVIQISFASDRMILRIPSAKAADSGLRKIGGPEMAERAFAIVAGAPQSESGPWRHRVVGMQNKIASGGLIELAEVVRDLRQKVNGGGGNSTERGFFDVALERLTAELALIAGEDRIATTQRLAALLG